MENPSPDQPRRWRRTRIVLIVLAGLVTLLAIVWLEENWRGKHAWQQYKREWEAKGERFDLASYLPKPVPPEQNFAATPFLAPLLDYDVVLGDDVRWRDPDGVQRILSVSIHDAAFARGDWQKGEFSDLAAAQERLRSDTNFPARPQSQTPPQDVLFALEKYQRVLAELHGAKDRPYAIFSSQLDASPTVAMQQFTALKSLSQVTLLRASAYLEEGRTGEALADVELTFRLAQLLQSKPLLISQMVRVAILRSSLQPIWEGLARRRWTEPELRKLQEMLTSVRLLDEYGLTMRGERAFSCELMAQMIAGRLPGAPVGPAQSFRSIVPRGLFYQNQIAICRVFQQVILGAVDAERHRVYPEKINPQAFEAAVGRHTPYNILVRMLFPAVQRSAQQCAYAQTTVDLAAVACALERHRLASGKYPESLDELVPNFMAKLPTDVMTGQPLKYQRDSDTVALYSVGWNKTDDEGEMSVKKRGTVDPEKGDWVWHY